MVLSTGCRIQGKGISMEIILNGEKRQVEAGLSILALVENAGKTPATVAVEKEGLIVPRDSYGDIILQEGDRLEMVHFVQGG